MKIRLLVVAVIAVLAGACNKPKTINDEDLRKIIEEIYLSNAYFSSKISYTDSLDMYNPILEKYGYDEADFEYTIANFSKRKSSRISDVIDDVNKSLEAQYVVYEQLVAALDTIDARAYEISKSIVRYDSTIVVKKLSDTTKLRIVIPAQPLGKYKISYSYFVDSTDMNRSLRTTVNILDSAARPVQSATNWLSASRRRRETINLESPASAKSVLMIFGNYPKDTKKAPNIRIDSLEVTYYLPKEKALDSLYRHIMDQKMKLNDTIRPLATKDSLTLRVHAPWLPEKRDSLARQ